MKHLIILISCLLIGISCNKKKNQPSQSNTTPAPAQPAAPAITSGPGSNSNSLHGVMQAMKLTVPSFNISGYESRAAFSSSPQPLSFYYMPGGIFATTGVSAGTLKLNGITLKYDVTTPNQTNRYVDTLNTRNYSTGVSWNLSANSSFSSFTTTVTRGFPVIANLNYLPAVISKSSGFTLSIGASNYSNTDSLLVFVVGPLGATNFKHVAGNATSVAFSALELSTIGTGNGFIFVYSSNYSNMSVSGKNYLYVMEHDLYRDLQINP